jgi:DNA topoisomerase IA
MEKRSLGTKATRAVIVSTLFLRSYFYKEKNGIHVSDLGKAVYKTLATYVPEILSESLTREMEKDLEGIAIDISKQKEVLEKAKKIVKNVCDLFKEKEEEIGKSFFEALEKMRNK